MQRIRDRLPELKPLFEQAASEYGLDWRLLAAIGYQESHWDSRAVSRTGVRGIMMLTQRTARQLGVEDRIDPEQRSEEHTSELQSRGHLVCRLLLEKKKK